MKIEGTFILRYRVFDIFSRPFNRTNDLAITAECYGDTFRVYSTKEFPGLQASTELTKVNVYILFQSQTYLFILCKSILLDGEFVLIFEKLNENDERGTKEGVLAPSILFLIIASGGVLKPLGLLVKMIKPSNIKAPKPRNRKNLRSHWTPVPPRHSSVQ